MAVGGSADALGALLGAVGWLGSADGSELGSVDGPVLVSLLGWVDGACDGLFEPPDRPSLTCVIVVPSPPEIAWPVSTSKPVMAAKASTNTAAVLARIGFHRLLGRPDAVA